jgi:hypothetical protein
MKSPATAPPSVSQQPSWVGAQHKGFSHTSHQRSGFFLVNAGQSPERDTSVVFGGGDDGGGGGGGDG